MSLGYRPQPGVVVICKGDDGTFFAEAAWPIRCIFDLESSQEPGAAPYLAIHEEDETVELRVANGSARYRRTGRGDYGWLWDCRLVSCEFEPYTPRAA